MNEQQFLENFKKRIVKDTIKKICKNYIILNDNNQEINEEELLNQLLKPKIIKRCVGTTKGTPVLQCTRNALDGYDYCKSHLYKLCLQETKQNVNLPEVSFQKLEKSDITGLQKVFIDDSFYFVDDKYIYDTNNIKVGYISNKEFILTSDPFILEMI
jgi:hypothetical protein